MDHPRFAVPEPPPTFALRIMCVSIVVPSPSYLGATLRHGHRTRPVLPNKSSKDARVGVHFVAFIVHEGPAQ
jgi:hypothetical protein